MKTNVLSAIVIGIGVLTLVNTYMIFNNSGVSYNKSEEVIPTNNLASTPQEGSIPLQINEDGSMQAQQTQQAAYNGPTTSIKFAAMEHDFGTIEQDSKNTQVFKFTNTGKEPLIISNATGSCGCTVPNYPRNPIAPGETGEIEVVYSPGKQVNQQTKTVSITANTEPATTVLRIKANVKPGEGNPGA